ncbi:hypothetical protein ABAC460_14555 [Asticcacaulis sp. AC460]|uniref:TetR family transcriptional regulator n=1 Tax=Asticcacaulis sp. AC460 TaxID=1282360 RepID=UPI0003C40505|nr:TetR family transcriptional regulator [Asticcacaulis sp. AC460]ESQ88998.1 hypothetical protein ABAC460_14555 [Asticcacaulis sp. AC460]
MAPRKALRIEDVATAALDIVAAEGVAGLTLRPLAARLGTTVAILSYQFGQKEALVEQVVAFAATGEAAYLDGWREALGGSTVLPATALAQIVEAVVADLTTLLRPQTLLFSELLFNVSGPEYSPAMATWIGHRFAFLQFLVAQVEPAPVFDLATLLQGYLIDESAYALALGGIDSYRWLQKLCIGRLCSGLCPPGPASGDEVLFDRHILALRRYAGAALKADEPVEGAQDLIAQAAGDLIAARGVAGVTHRAIAEQTNLAPSTVAYHFPSQPDLVRTGLARLVPPQQTRMELDGSSSYTIRDIDGTYERLRPYQAFELARAGFGIALAASRDPEWRPAAAGLRTLRGHFLKRALAGMTGPAHFDGLGAQALIVAASGIANLNACKGAEITTAMTLPVIFGTLDAIRFQATDYHSRTTV